MKSLFSLSRSKIFLLGTEGRSLVPRISAVRFKSTAAAAAKVKPTPNSPVESALLNPSQILCRNLEFYDQVLAEDLMILSYRHANVFPDSPYLKSIEARHLEENREFLELEQRKIEFLSQEARKSVAKKSAGAGPASRPQRALAPKPAQFTDYLNYLAPTTPPKDNETSEYIYENLPRLQEISLKMIMPQAVTHNKKILLNGLLALQLVTTQHAQIVRATHGDAKLRVRSGMPIGVQVRLTDQETMFTFLDKLVESVLPKLRDFRGFSKQSGSKPTIHPRGTLSFTPGKITLSFDAEAWLAFPEIELSYLKFPQMGQVGSLQPFELEFTTTAKTAEDARLLLSGFRIPFSFNEPPAELDEVIKEEFVHEI